ncbi:MAG: hypothetical protein AAF226_19445 [Verrucomicrobiota bacterium]
MNSLKMGFFYVVGWSWALCETCVIASNGNWMPLILFTIYFVLTFSILGCMPISDAAVSRAGGFLALLLGIGLVAIALGTLKVSAGYGIMKLIFAIPFVIAGVIAMLPAKEKVHAH